MKVIGYYNPNQFPVQFNSPVNGRPIMIDSDTPMVNQHNKLVPQDPSFDRQVTAGLLKPIFEGDKRFGTWDRGADQAASVQPEALDGEGHPIVNTGKPLGEVKQRTIPEHTINRSGNHPKQESTPAPLPSNPTSESTSASDPLVKDAILAAALDTLKAEGKVEMDGNVFTSEAAIKRYIASSKAEE